VKKLYYFHGPDSESGVFIGAETWKEARKMSTGHDFMDGHEFIDIRGSLCRENGKPVLTEVHGEHEAHEILATGYTGFWWMGNCDICGEDCEMLRPKGGKLICSECENPDDAELAL